MPRGRRAKGSGWYWHWHLLPGALSSLLWPVHTCSSSWKGSLHVSLVVTSLVILCVSDLARETSPSAATPAGLGAQQLCHVAE